MIGGALACFSGAKVEVSRGGNETGEDDQENLITSSSRYLSATTDAVRVLVVVKGTMGPSTPWKARSLSGSRSSSIEATT